MKKVANYVNDKRREAEIQNEVMVIQENFSGLVCSFLLSLFSLSPTLVFAHTHKYLGKILCHNTDSSPSTN